MENKKVSEVLKALEVVAGAGRNLNGVEGEIEEILRIDNLIEKKIEEMIFDTRRIDRLVADLVECKKAEFLVLLGVRKRLVDELITKNVRGYELIWKTKK